VDLQKVQKVSLEEGRLVGAEIRHFLIQSGVPYNMAKEVLLNFKN
jgi:hypothetical protein